IVMARSKGKEKLELALVGGKTESQLPNENQMLDYADGRFIKDGQQISVAECMKIIFENPRLSLAREVVEELTGKKQPDHSDFQRLDWILSKIKNSSPDNWTVVTTNKQVKLKDESKIPF